jgi:predicted ATP-dependent protease
MPKLTLSAAKDIIEKAKRVAEDRGTSVSAMFSQFVQSVSTAHDAGRHELGPMTRRACGLVTLPADKTDRQLVEEALAERHGT